MGQRDVLVCWDCHNKMVDRGASKFWNLGSPRPTEPLTSSAPGEGPLPDSRMATFSMCPPSRGGKGVLCCLLLPGH